LAVAVLPENAGPTTRAAVPATIELYSGSYRRRSRPAVDSDGTDVPGRIKRPGEHAASWSRGCRSKVANVVASSWPARPVLLAGGSPRLHGVRSRKTAIGSAGVGENA
jgi:hypothetical protein